MWTHCAVNPVISSPSSSVRMLGVCYPIPYISHVRLSVSIFNVGGNTFNDVGGRQWSTSHIITILKKQKAGAFVKCLGVIYTNI